MELKITTTAEDDEALATAAAQYSKERGQEVTPEQVFREKIADDLAGFREHHDVVRKRKARELLENADPVMQQAIEAFVLEQQAKRESMT